MKTIESASAEQFDTAVIGNGPAAIGIFVAAARAGLLQKLLDKGIVVIGNTPTIGSGKLGGYQIRSNSPGGDFLEPFDKSIDRTFDDVLEGEDARSLRSNATEIAPLEQIGRFINSIGERVRGLLDKHPACAYLQANADGVQAQIDDSLRIFSQDRALLARSVILATGGRQKAKSSDTVFTADTYLREPEGLHNVLADDSEIQILGSSHSAFSTADRLLKHADETNRNLRIRLRHRSPIRLFYDLQKEPPPDWYRFEPEDVCPKTDRVHRFGGLRGDARALFLRIRNGDEKRVRLETAGTGTDSFNGITIDATGYETNRIPLVDHDDRPIDLSISEDGQTDVNAFGRIKTRSGKPGPNIYGIGLGYGIRPNGIGEPRFNGRLDGVNVYWGPVGETIVQSILDQAN